MKIKTLLRKCHTYLGTAIAIPTLIITLTGLYLLSNNPKESGVIASTICDDKRVVIVTNDGFQGVDLGDYVPFSFQSVASIACHNGIIDVALTDGPIASTHMDDVMWQIIPRPFNGRIHQISRNQSERLVSTRHEVWLHQNGEWQPVLKAKPSITQAIYLLHAGWVNGQSITSIWWATGIIWCFIVVSGVWILIRLIRRK